MINNYHHLVGTRRQHFHGTELVMEDLTGFWTQIHPFFHKRQMLFHGLKEADVLYLYPVHAGLHLQLLHSFSGLGDARCAVVGDAVLHGAPAMSNSRVDQHHTKT